MPFHPILLIKLRGDEGIQMEKKAEKTSKPTSKPKLTDAERHKRFVDMAHEVQADESPESFDRAFDRVLEPPSNPKGSST